MEGLDGLDPDEVESCEAVEPKEVSNVNSPFAHMLNNLISGGGRQGMQDHHHIKLL